MKALRSTRRFLPRPVEADRLEQLIEVARWTGSARNRQPWRFIALADPGRQRRLGELGAYAQHLATAPLVLVLLSEDNGRLDTEFDVGRVSQTIALAAHELGLGSCLATLHPADRVDAAARLLGAPPGWLPRHAMSVGYPAPPALLGPSAVPTGRLAVGELLTRLPPPGADLA